MVGSIYIIENDVNNKVYIGQTSRGIHKRFAEHVLDSVEIKDNNKFHRAMRDIGVEHFYISELCRCNLEDLNRLEMYYIQKYNSYADGYNSTAGGSGASTASKYSVKTGIRAAIDSVKIKYGFYWTKA